MPLAAVKQQRDLLTTNGLGQITPVDKGAAVSRKRSRRHCPFFSAFFLQRVGAGDCFQEQSCIGVHGVLKDLACFSLLNDSSKIDNNHFRSYIFNNTEIMADENKCQVVFCL